MHPLRILGWDHYKKNQIFHPLNICFCLFILSAWTDLLVYQRSILVTSPMLFGVLTSYHFLALICIFTLFFVQKVKGQFIILVYDHWFKHRNWIKLSGMFFWTRYFYSLLIWILFRLKWFNFPYPYSTSWLSDLWW